MRAIKHVVSEWKRNWTEARVSGVIQEGKKTNQTGKTDGQDRSGWVIPRLCTPEYVGHAHRYNRSH